MSLRLKFGLTEVIRMSVELDASVTAAVKSALVEGDWVTILSAGAVSGVPASAGGVSLKVSPVASNATAGKKLSYALIVNPQSPENSVPGIGLTVACDRGFIGYTDRFDPGLGAAAYAANTPLAAHSFVVAGVTRYGLLPLVGADSTINSVVAYSLGILNGELVFRYMP